MGKLLLQGTCPKTVRQVGSVDTAANLEPSHEAVAKQRLERPTGTTALWRDGTGKLDPSHTFLTTEQMLTIVKAGCGKSARPVWEADGGQHRKVRLLRPDSKETPEIGVERRRGSCADAFQADREPGDGPQGIETPTLPETATGVRKLQRTLYRQAMKQPGEQPPRAGCGKSARPVR